MPLACLWDRWSKEGEPDLYSFAAITDEPPPEVAAAGHDRCLRFSVDRPHLGSDAELQQLERLAVGLAPIELLEQPIEH